MTQTLTRNEAFAQTKMEQLQAEQDKAAAIQRQVEAGELRDLGGGRYEVLTGWDRGEVITFNGRDILAENGLEVRNGKTSLYVTKRPAWHKFGQFSAEGLTDLDAIIEAGGMDFEIRKVPAFYKLEADGPYFASPDHYTLVRVNKDGSNLSFGPAGRYHQPIQPRDAFEFMSELAGYDWTDEMRWLSVESAGVLRGGRKVFITMRLSENVVLDAEGIADEIVMYLCFICGMDQSERLRAVMTPWRIECGNTERFALHDAKTSWGVRKTVNALSEKNVAAAKQQLGLVEKYSEAWQQESMELLGESMTIDQFLKAMDDVFGKPDEDASKRAITLHQKRQDKLAELFGRNAKMVGPNAYAARLAGTEYIDHHQNVKESRTAGGGWVARATYALEGEYDDTKSKLHKRLLLTVKR